MARQGVEGRRPGIPVNEKVSGDQVKATSTAKSRGAEAGMTVKPETASLGNTSEERSGDNGTTDNPEEDWLSGTSLGCETRGDVHR